MQSVLYAMLEGISDELGIERTDIKGCTFMSPYNGRWIHSLIIYDAAAGGTGHVRRLLTPDGMTLHNVIAAALKRVENCTCDTSCYFCLRNYYNQKIHDKLNRHSAADFLRRWTCIPSPIEIDEPGAFVESASDISEINEQSDTKDYKRLSEGSFEITDDTEMSRFAANSEPKESQCRIPVFDGYSAEELISFGLSAEQADLLNEIKDEKLYQLIRATFTGYQATVIEMCEAGFTGGEIREWLATERESETVVKDTVCDGVFVIDDDNSVEEFRKAVNGEIEPWRLFLNPLQEKYAFGNFSGAVYVCGEAGTGKTVAAIHRAKHLAERIEGAERILVTTFTKNLAMDISDMLDKMCTYNRDRTDVVNIDNLATRRFGKYFPNYSIMYEKTADKLWKELITRNQIEEKFNLSFFKKEWERLIIPENITTLDSYISADRTGLGYPMNRRQRAAAWTVLENFRESCPKAVEKNLAYKMLSDKLRSSGEIYVHIIADEVQDFSAAMLELLSVLSGGQHENDIYLTGDPSQNLYGKNVHLRKCGINIANSRYQLSLHSMQNSLRLSRKRKYSVRSFATSPHSNRITLKISVFCGDFFFFSVVNVSLISDSTSLRNCSPSSALSACFIPRPKRAFMYKPVTALYIFRTTLASRRTDVLLSTLNM